MAQAKTQAMPLQNESIHTDALYEMDEDNDDSALFQKRMQKI
jgi:hypothetical protein